MSRLWVLGLFLIPFLSCMEGSPPSSPSSSSVSQETPTPTPTPAPTPPPIQFSTGSINDTSSGSSFRQSLERNLRTIQKSPRNYDAYMQIGAAYHQLGQLKSAERAFENASLIRPNRVEPFIELGIVQMEAGRYVKAIDTYRDLLRRDPENRSLKNTLAAAYRKKKD